jgi:hypothetical protein
MRPPSCNKTAPCVLALGLGVLSSQTPAAQFVEISAEIESFGYRLKDIHSIEKAAPNIVHVRCVAGTNRWFIEEDYFGSKRWWFDGAHVVRRSQPLSTSDTASTIGDEVWRSTDGHPLGDFGVNLPWLAFCSGSYLKREGRIVPLPAAILRHCPDRYAYTDFTTTFTDELGLPRTLDLFSSQARFLKSHTDWDKELSFGDRYTEWEKKTAAKIQDGVLVFHYAALESTNILGWNFPLRFEFFQIGRQYEQDGNWFCQGTGRIKSIGGCTNFPTMK